MWFQLSWSSAIVPDAIDVAYSQIFSQLCKNLYKNNRRQLKYVIRIQDMEEIYLKVVSDEVTFI